MNAGITLQIHACKQHAHTAAKHCPYDISQRNEAQKKTDSCVLHLKKVPAPSFYRRLGKLEGKKKKQNQTTSLYQQEDAI